GANEEARSLAGKARCARQIALQEAPHQHLDQWPVDQLGGPRPGGAGHIPIAQDHCPNACRRGLDRRLLADAPGGPRGTLHAIFSSSARGRRAMARKTSSSVLRPKRAIRSLGVSSAITRPFSSMITRSAKRSTSAMLWEAKTTVARRVRQ